VAKCDAFTTSVHGLAYESRTLHVSTAGGPGAVCSGCAGKDTRVDTCVDRIVDLTDDSSPPPLPSLPPWRFGEAVPAAPARPLRPGRACTLYVSHLPASVGEPGSFSSAAAERLLVHHGATRMGRVLTERGHSASASAVAAVQFAGDEEYVAAAMESFTAAVHGMRYRGRTLHVGVRGRVPCPTCCQCAKPLTDAS
jgi:hypothetical protein